MHIRSVDSHDVLLVARMSVARCLKRQPFSVVAEIRFGILSAEGDLANVVQVRFAWGPGNCPRRRRARTARSWHSGQVECMPAARTRLPEKCNMRMAENYRFATE